MIYLWMCFLNHKTFQASPKKMAHTFTRGAIMNIGMTKPNSKEKGICYRSSIELQLLKPWVL